MCQSRTAFTCKADNRVSPYGTALNCQAGRKILQGCTDTFQHNTGDTFQVYAVTSGQDLQRLFADGRDFFWETKTTGTCGAMRFATSSATRSASA